MKCMRRPPCTTKMVEVDFDVAAEAAASVPDPELQKSPRRTRKERKAAEPTVEQSEPVQEEITTEQESEEPVTAPEETMNTPEPPVRGQRRRRTRS